MLQSLERTQQKHTDGSNIVSSHQERSLNIAAEIIVLAAGKVTQQGPRDQILPGLLGTTSAVTACTALEQGGREA